MQDRGEEWESIHAWKKNYDHRNMENDGHQSSPAITDPTEPAFGASMYQKSLTGNEAQTFSISEDSGTMGARIESATRIQNQLENVKNTGMEKRGILARLFESFITSFRRCLPKRNAQNISTAKLKRLYSLLHLWGDDYNVKSGELDQLLESSVYIRRKILQHLCASAQLFLNRESRHLFPVF